MAKYTQAQLDDLRGHYARGALEVGQGSERVRFRSLDEMARLIAEIERSLAPAVTSDVHPGAHYPTMSRGT